MIGKGERIIERSVTRVPFQRAARPHVVRAPPGLPETLTLTCAEGDDCREARLERAVIALRRVVSRGTAVVGVQREQWFVAVADVLEQTRWVEA